MLTSQGRIRGARGQMASSSRQVAISSRRVAGAWRQLASSWRQLAKFGTVGLAALVVDVGAFNVLRSVNLQDPGQGWLVDKPIAAKVVSAVLATTFAYAANRWWTFADRGGSGLMREYVLFFVLNGIASLIAVGCLWLSHYALGLDSLIADNISANVIGLALGTMFRWWSYRRWVFPERVTDESTAPEAVPA